MSQRLKDGLAVATLVVMILVGLKSELSALLVGWWTGLTPWRFLFVLLLSGLVCWATDRFLFGRLRSLEKSITDASAELNKRIGATYQSIDNRLTIVEKR